MSNPAAVQRPVDVTGADSKPSAVPRVAFFDHAAPHGLVECSHRILSARRHGFGGHVESTPT